MPLVRYREPSAFALRKEMQDSFLLFLQSGQRDMAGERRGFVATFSELALSLPLLQKWLRILRPRPRRRSALC